MPQRIFGPVPEDDILHFHAHLKPLPEFPALTHVHEVYCGQEHHVPPHMHETFEISCMAEGHCTWNVEGTVHTLHKHDILTIRPGEIHSGGTLSAPYQIYVVGIDPSALILPWGEGGNGTDSRQEHSGNRLSGGWQHLTRLSAEEQKRLHERKAQGVLVWDAPARDVSQAVGEVQLLKNDLHALSQRVIPGGPGAAQIYRRLLAELDEASSSGTLTRTLKVMMVQALLVELFIFIARCHTACLQETVPPSTIPERAEFHHLQRWLHTRLDTPPSLEEMAKKVGLSPSHFSVLFKRETGLTPLEYMTKRRIDEAAARLSDATYPSSITRIALELGFSSSQYFSLVFKKYKGCTPKEWRSRCR